MRPRLLLGGLAAVAVAAAHGSAFAKVYTCVDPVTQARTLSQFPCPTPAAEPPAVEPAAVEPAAVEAWAVGRAATLGTPTTLMVCEAASMTIICWRCCSRTVIAWLPETAAAAIAAPVVGMWPGPRRTM